MAWTCNTSPFLTRSPLNTKSSRLSAQQKTRFHPRTNRSDSLSSAAHRVFSPVRTRSDDAKVKLPPPPRVCRRVCPPPQCSGGTPQPGLLPRCRTAPLTARRCKPAAPGDGRTRTAARQPPRARPHLTPAQGAARGPARPGPAPPRPRPLAASYPSEHSASSNCPGTAWLIATAR